MPIYMMPALLIRMSTGPSARIRAKPSVTEASRVTSISAMAMRGEYASSSAFLACVASLGIAHRAPDAVASVGEGAHRRRAEAAAGSG
jgi:hypothetical protein